MSSTARRTLRRATRAAALATASVLALGMATPAAAAGRDSVEEYVRKYDHPMGSQIALREGRPGVPDRVRVDPSTLDILTQGKVYGIDVSGWQRNVDWRYWWNKGKRFAYIKATEGNYYKNPYFTQQYNGSYNVGMIRGAYHFARPDKTSGAYQADYFLARGGGWSPDGKTLPGALDMEWNPYGDACYGKTQWGIIRWVRSFSDRYHDRTGRYPVIYTSRSWWTKCTGNRAGFKTTNPLWVARYGSNPGTLPHDWDYHTFWQYSNSPIDQNVFNGSYTRLKVLALG